MEPSECQGYCYATDLWSLLKENPLSLCPGPQSHDRLSSWGSPRGEIRIHQVLDVGCSFPVSSADSFLTQLPGIPLKLGNAVEGKCGRETPIPCSSRTAPELFCGPQVHQLVTAGRGTCQAAKLSSLGPPAKEIPVAFLHPQQARRAPSLSNGAHALPPRRSPVQLLASPVQGFPGGK